MDCEGAEYDVLINLPEDIWNKIENIILEAHPTKKYRPEEIKRLLMSKDFFVTEKNLKNSCFEYFCTKKAER